MQLPTGASRVVFILAHPAAHVSAPRYYTPYFREQGLDWHMVPLDVAPKHLADTIRTLATSASVVGFNLTMPHKPAAFELVNATSLGLHATDNMPMDSAKLPGDCAVFDIIAARRTEFMNAAAARGLKVVDGVAMIRHQLPLQTAFWKGLS